MESAASRAIRPNALSTERQRDLRVAAARRGPWQVATTGVRAPRRARCPLRNHGPQWAAGSARGDVGEEQSDFRQRRRVLAVLQQLRARTRAFLAERGLAMRLPEGDAGR